jgi:hypothetical protein
MTFEDQVRALLPELRNACDLASEVEDLIEEVFQDPRYLPFLFSEQLSPDVLSKDGAAGEPDASEGIRSFLLKRGLLLSTLEGLQPKVRGLLQLTEDAPLTNSGQSEFVEFAALCLQLERAHVPRAQGQISDAEAGGESLRIPWFLGALGELILELLPKNASPELLRIAGDWVRLAAEEFYGVVTHKAPGERSSLAETAASLADWLCGDAQYAYADVVLALDKIASVLDDPNSLRSKLAPVALPALESVPDPRHCPDTFVGLLAVVARRIETDPKYADQFQRLMKVLWRQSVEDSYYHARHGLGVIGEAPIEEWTADEMEMVRRLAAGLAAFFWLARLYRKKGDEGRELFCGYVFTDHRLISAETWEQLGIEWGWTTEEQDEVTGRVQLLRERLAASVAPWTVTPVVSRIELTPPQVESIAQAAADSTAQKLLAGGTLGELLAASVEPELAAQFSKEVWSKIPAEAQQALIAATFVSKSQPPRLDFSGAVVLDWKALEITLDKLIFDSVFQQLPAQFLLPRERRGLNLKLASLDAAVRQQTNDRLAREVRAKLTACSSPILKWSNVDFLPELRVRNRAAHARRTGRSDFERSRARVFPILRALLR